MSKPDLPGGQSLEEILASIRKTLADQQPDEGLSKLDDGQLNGVDHHPAGTLNGSTPSGGKSLRDQLAGAFDIVPERQRTDDDLSDLLASELKADPERKPQTNGQGRDPLWFLSRGAAKSDADAKAQAPAAKQPEEIKLTRPETVRRSFPPLFGSGETPPPPSLELPTERVKPAEAVKPTEPVKLTEPAAPAPAKAAEKPVEPAATVAAPAMVATPAKPAAKAEVPAPKPEPKPAPAKSEPMVDLAPPPALELEPEIEDEPVVDRPEVAVPAPAVTQTVAEPPTLVLQQAIGRMLEPVIQQWLDTHLPRMVEAAIREEVARQVKAVAPKDLKI